MRNGEEHVIIIDSERMTNSGYYGYEAIFDDGDRAFAVEDGIYDWEGKDKYQQQYSDARIKPSIIGGTENGHCNRRAQREDKASLLC